MTKQEFLEKLRMALNGKVTPGQLAENLRYYEDYINTEIRKGKEEEEVLSALGDPRLIARTIVETGGGSGSRMDFQEDAGRGYEGWAEGSGDAGRRNRAGGRLPNLLLRIPLWGWLLIFLVIVVLVLSFVFSVIAAVLPVLLPILLVVFLVKLFRDWIS